MLIACMCIFPLTGCSVRETARKLDAAEDRLENRVDYWEYDYDIHADNGTILSFDVDD